MLSAFRAIIGTGRAFQCGAFHATRPFVSYLFFYRGQTFVGKRFPAVVRLGDELRLSL